MTIGSHLEEFHGLPTFDFPQADEPFTDLPEPASVAWRVSVDSYESEESWTDAFARFADTVDLTEVRAFVAGAWSDAYEQSSQAIVDTLVAARDRLPELRALFLGDMTLEECEISWIIQSSVSPLLNAFPRLLEFGVRGGTDLTFPPVRHERLRSLTVETGGLGTLAVTGIGESDFPALERLDLWLGTPDYGGDASLADLEPFLTGARLPRLRHLALRNSEIQDEIAVALASAPVVARLESLDLSMGTLSDTGATALLDGQPLTHLKSLDLHHHFLTEPVLERLRRSLESTGVALDLDDDDAESYEHDGAVHRLVSVAE